MLLFNVFAVVSQVEKRIILRFSVFAVSYKGRCAAAFADHFTECGKLRRKAVAAFAEHNVGASARTESKLGGVG